MADERMAALRRGYEAFNRGAVDEVLPLASPDFVAEDRPELPDPATHHGIEGARAAVRAAREGFDDFRIEPEEFIEVGEHIVVVARQTGRGAASGVEVAGTIVHVWGYDGDRLVSLRAFSEREQALASLGAGTEGGDPA
jgi:ketosteroid isomerase-like protein